MHGRHSAWQSRQPSGSPFCWDLAGQRFRCRLWRFRGAGSLLYHHSDHVRNLTTEHCCPIGLSSSFGAESEIHSLRSFAYAHRVNLLLGDDSSAVSACLPPKVHGGTHTLWALDLLCGVSKQHVAPIPAEGHLGALNDAAYSLRRSGQENGTKYPDPRFCLPPVMAATRKLIWIEESRFRGWGCSDWRQAGSRPVHQRSGHCTLRKRRPPRSEGAR